MIIWPKDTFSIHSEDILALHEVLERSESDMVADFLDWFDYAVEAARDAGLQVENTSVRVTAKLYAALKEVAEIKHY